VNHKGKVPKHQGAKDSKYRLRQMKEELNAFIKKEEYEEAAKLRDEIKEVETALNLKKKSATKNKG